MPITESNDQTAEMNSYHTSKHLLLHASNMLFALSTLGALTYCLVQNINDIKTLQGCDANGFNQCESKQWLDFKQTLLILDLSTPIIITVSAFLTALFSLFSVGIFKLESEQSATDTHLCTRPRIFGIANATVFGFLLGLSLTSLNIISKAISDTKDLALLEKGDPMPEEGIHNIKKALHKITVYESLALTVALIFFIHNAVATRKASMASPYVFRIPSDPVLDQEGSTLHNPSNYGSINDSPESPRDNARPSNCCCLT